MNHNSNIDALHPPLRQTYVTPPCLSHGSLFSGIGGFDLAAQWMGWKNTFHCEWNPFGQKILKYYWPNAISYDDITKTDFTIHRGRIDVLTGGFPCQPYSIAGKRKGKDDERHLWPEMLRAIREIQPRYVVAENVFGLINWNGGMVFNEVQADLEAEGYEVIPFVLPACGVNAPHRRDRVWFVAYSESFRNNRAKCANRGQGCCTCKYNRNEISSLIVNACGEWPTTHSNNTGGGAGLGEIQKENGEISQRNNDAEPCNTSDGHTQNSNQNGRGCELRGKESGEWEQRNTCAGNNEQLQTNNDEVGDIANTNNKRLQGGEKFGSFGGIGKERNKQPTGCVPPTWQNFPTQSPICGGDDGLPTELDGITFSKWRTESIKAFGNAIVPQVAYQIFKAIQEYEVMLSEA